MLQGPEHHEQTSDLTRELMELADLQDILAVSQELSSLESGLLQPELLEGVIPYVSIDQTKLAADLSKSPDEYLQSLEKNNRLDDLYIVDYTKIT